MRDEGSDSFRLASSAPDDTGVSRARRPSCAPSFTGGGRAVSGRTPGHFLFVSYYAARTWAAPQPRALRAPTVRERSDTPRGVGGPSPLEVGNSMIRVGQSRLLII
jgi:hypothetical protein